MSTILTDDEIAAIPVQDCAENYARAVEAAVLAKLAQQADRQRVPGGHVLVPVEPTDKMVDAAIAAGWSRIDIYRAMLAAAPEAPAQASAVELTVESTRAALAKNGGAA